MTDTTAGGGRGGVGIRLFTSGGEVVKRTFDQVGDSGKKMWAEIAMGEKAANPALRAMSRASGEAQGAVQGLGSRAGGAANVLGAFGTAGVVAAAAAGALVLALNQTREAMRFADDLEDSAAKINIGVEALQTWRFAAVEAGGAATDADSAIDGFQKKLGEGLAGGRSIKWFERLGFSRDDLKAFKSTEEALDAVIGRIADLGTEAERAAIAEKLGLGPLVPLIRLGSDAIDEMRQRAVDLGIVMDESMVKRGAEANREMEVLSQIIDLQLKQAFIDLAPVLLETLKFVGWLAEGIRDVAEAWKDLDDRSTAGLRKNYAAHQAVVTNMMNRRGVNSPDDLNPLARRQFNQSNERMGEIAAVLAARAAVRTPGPIPDGNTLRDVDTARRARGGGGGADRSGREAEQRRRAAERALEALAREELDLERAALEARFGPGGWEENATELGLAKVTLEAEAQNAQRQVLRAQLEKAGALDADVEVRLEELRIAQGELKIAEDRRILQEERRDLAAKNLAQEQARDEDAIALMDIDEQMARTNQERFAIARRILLAQQALEQKLLEAELGEDGKLSDEDKERLGRNAHRQGREVELFDHSTRERMRADFHSYGNEIVDAIEAGRIGEHIGDQLKARLIEMALDGLFNFLNPEQGGGSTGGGGGGFWTMAANFAASMFGGGSGPGRAGGGPLWRGVRHPVVETGKPELLMLGGQGQVTSAAETARLLKETLGASGGGGGGLTVNEHHHKWDLRGAVVTEDLMKQMEAKANAAEVRAVRQSLHLSRRSAPAMQQRLRRTGTT
jgi:hypothetical protein